MAAKKKPEKPEKAPTIVSVSPKNKKPWYLRCGFSTRTEYRKSKY